jgi:hypothetical protein
MSSGLFPARPRGPVLRPEPVVRVVRRRTLASIHEALGWTLHDVINDPGRRHTVASLYKAARRIERASAMRQGRVDFAYRIWLRDHL